MNRNIKIFIPTLLLFALAAVVLTRNNAAETGNVNSVACPAMDGVADSAAMIVPRYAKGFTVRYPADGVRLVDVCDPQQEHTTTYHFALIPRGATLADGIIPDGYERIETPICNAICMTSLQLSNFIALNAVDRVVGITSTRHLFNPAINAQLHGGVTQKIGIEGNFDSEVIFSLAPDVIFISPFKRGGYDTLREVGTPLIPHMGYKETTPLGQAEWVKFVSLFTGQESEANVLFDAIADEYNALKERVADVEKRPMVFSGEIRGGNWYAVGGKSFLAELFRDAGADYFLKDDSHSGGVTLDFETVYSQAESADFWRIVNSYDGDFSYDVLRGFDVRYADFKAFRQRGVIYCNMRLTPFYESMPMEPQRVLADLIHCFHPEVLQNYTPTYYKRLP